MILPQTTIKELWSYPIKSCGGILHDSVRTSEMGLGDDRAFAVVGKDHCLENEVLTQRHNPELARVALRAINDHYVVSALGSEIAFDPQAEPIGKTEPVALFAKAGEAVEMSEELSQLFSEVVKRDVRLMKIVRPRIVKPATHSIAEGANNRMGFADGYPLQITSLASLAAVNGWLEEMDKDHVEMRRFRPSIVIDGLYDEDGREEAFGEDKLRVIKLGNVGAEVVRAVARCAMIVVNPDTGKFDEAGKQLSKILMKHRRGKDPFSEKDGKFFGQYAIHKYTSQTIRVGDAITTYRSADAPNFEATAKVD